MNLRKERDKGKKVSRRPPGVQVAARARARARARAPPGPPPPASRAALSGGARRVTAGRWCWTRTMLRS
jgi:hypothetical protein